MAYAPIEVSRGDSFSKDIYYYVNGVVTSLVGYTVFVTLKKVLDTDIDDSSAVVQSDLSGQGTFSSGYAQLTWTPSQMLIPEGKYNFNIRVNGAGTLVASTDNIPFTVVLGSTQRSS